jgi:hypothetical protein
MLRIGYFTFLNGYHLISKGGRGKIDKKGAKSAFPQEPIMKKITILALNGAAAKGVPADLPAAPPRSIVISPTKAILRSPFCQSAFHRPAEGI